MKLLNNLVSFLLELAMLGALGYWGFHADGPALLKWGLGIGVPALVIVFWSVFMAPNAAHRLAWPWLPAVTLVLFLASALVLYAANARSAALVLAVVSVANVALVFVWHQE
jgi:hypothetical protein